MSGATSPGKINMSDYHMKTADRNIPFVSFEEAIDAAVSYHKRTGKWVFIEGPNKVPLFALDIFGLPEMLRAHEKG
jgi:hypothetical protein